MCETENCSKAPCHRCCRGNTAVVPVCPRRGAPRGHPTWTCPRVFCARPTGSAFTPALPAPISLLLPPCCPQPLTLSISLFFSSPFASFSCWLSRFQASRPRCFRAPSSAPDFHGLPAPPSTHPRMLRTTRHHRDGDRGTIVEGLGSIALLCPAGLLGFATQKMIHFPPKCDSSPQSWQRGFSVCCPTAFPWDTETWVSSGGPRGPGLLVQPETAPGAFALPPIHCLWALFLPFPSSSSPPS